ncbi:MAG: hypothetical protein ACLUFD_06475 [Faecalibacterium sp.]
MLSETQFPFLAEKGHVVSLVGGGGKPPCSMPLPGIVPPKAGGCW